MAGPQLWLVRHGETEWSAIGRHTGRTDLTLTEDGRAKAADLRDVLADHDFAMVLSSPLQRARQTCDLAGFGARAETDVDLREWDYGDYEGLTTGQIKQTRPDWSLWRDGCPGGEAADDVGRRADRVIAKACAADGDVVAFAHGHLLRVLAARWIGLDPADGALLGLDTASVSILGWERDQPVLRRWNLSADHAGLRR
ncbi:MAG TPA: histidine phosphatase family protein [Mycobacteriales bacterium]|nr:histidine phosphatase family protein [Mycobacteriales bacterium]